MDPAHVFRQGLGSVAPRQNQHQTINFPTRPPLPHDDLSDDHGDGHGGRIAHTLTACCRCRQRKTRCDPTLPRCLPCERSGSVCEYLDTARGRKINRNYVIKLQDKVRALEAELAQFVDDEGEYPHSSEDMVRPGGMVRLGGGDETPRYLGPSSGIAMSRLLMEEAKRFTQSNRVSDLIPDLRARRQNRMQSIQMTASKSYPTTSERPAEELPSRGLASKLVEIFKQKGQIFWPTLHETAFEKDLEDVYNGDADVYKRFVVHMVFAIGLQRMSIQYAGLADAFYQAAMKDFETVLRPKDLKTLQCLVLIGQYSLITPTRVPVYYVIGLATKICQQEGLVDEKTITTGYNLDPLTIDMRRRLVWSVASMEFGLAHSLGRPNSFATCDEQLDVNFMSTVEDEYITENGIEVGPTSPRKVAAIHAFRMRILQAEVRRTLYERKRPEPKDDSSPWYQQMENRLKDWLDACPENPPWCKPWFLTRYNQILISMYRPSPQVSTPSPAAAEVCFKSAGFVIETSRKQMDDGSVGITWVFLLVLNMALNTLLWTISYAEVRAAHPREETEELVNQALDVLDGCEERWPGSGTSSELYSIFSKACLQSYENRTYQPNSILATPPAPSETSASPDTAYSQAVNDQQPTFLNPPQFGNVFDSSPESMNNYALDSNFPPPQPQFRSNSIFQNPVTTDNHGRRFSYFPPDFSHMDDAGPTGEVAAAPNAIPDQHQFASPPHQLTGQHPTPPDSMASMSSAASNVTLSPPSMPPAPSQPPPTMGMQPPIPPSTKVNPAHPQAAQRIPPYTMPQSAPPAPQRQQQQQPRGGMAQQRPLPQQPPAATTSGDWFSPPAAFISPYNFGSMGSTFYNDLSGLNTFVDFSGSDLGLQDLNGGPPGNPHFGRPAGRQGSLTQSQQMELMNVLETQGVSDIDAFLKGGAMSDGRWY